jgi:hypothetical protein
MSMRSRYLCAMLDVGDEYETLVNLVFLLGTGLIAWHGIRYRDAEGKTDFVRLLFGCIAATYFCLVLFQDVLGIVRF